MDAGHCRGDFGWPCYPVSEVFRYGPGFSACAEGQGALWICNLILVMRWAFRGRCAFPAGRVSFPSPPLSRNNLFRRVCVTLAYRLCTAATWGQVYCRGGDSKSHGRDEHSHHITTFHAHPPKVFLRRSSQWAMHICGSSRAAADVVPT